MSGRFGAAILGCAGPVLTPEERAFFQKANPFGFILFARNIDTGDQTRALCADLRESVGWDAPIFLDQEGGRVQRLRPPLATDWPAPLDHVRALGDNAAQGMALRFQITALEMRAVGIDANCAPMLDVARDSTHPFLRNRCYGTTPDRVIAIGRAVADGLMAGGVLPVIKHMPGHGLAQMDSHLELPRIDADVQTLDAVDFAPFRAFADLPMGMTAHLVYSALDPDPATISPKMMSLIRDDIGFGGLIMTDDISMQALSGTVAERGAASLAAGCDFVLHCNGDLEEMRALMDRVGQADAAAQARAKAAIAARRAPEEVDIESLKHKLGALPLKPADD
ncbi:beta-N-acetylhexosaminidase [Thalassococcus sp. BH17M4-6]|uniref:beta-N-acetylhexosaminidase n=1 Tax=Thalassococcus sp. BH17M4-6 TaxID=3413148 RepID=UPI003BD13A70